MKFCSKCGAEMKDDDLFCPRCGNSTDERTVQQVNKDSIIDESVVSKTTDIVKKNNSKMIFWALAIIGAVIGITGVILLIVGGYKEYKFRTSYDLSKLTDAGIIRVRSLTPYANSMGLITAGAICIFVSLILNLVSSIYRVFKIKKGMI